MTFIPNFSKKLNQKYEIWVNPAFLPIKNLCETYIFQTWTHFEVSFEDIFEENQENEGFYPKNLYFFYLIKTKTNEIHAQMGGICENGLFDARPKATFGGISMKKGIDFEVLSEFLHEIILFLKEKNAQNIIFKQFPSIYDTENMALLTKILELQNFGKKTELNYILPLKNADFFEKNLHNSAFRHLKKAQEQGFLFEKIDFLQASQVYDHIHTHRTRKGYPMTMQKPDFLHLWANFPAEMQVFVLKEGNKWVALCVFLAISKDILYYFYPADNPQYQKFSPMTLLIYKVLEHAILQGFKYIDLGIATEEGMPNPNLMRYKANIGGIVGEKCTFFANFVAVEPKPIP